MAALVAFQDGGEGHCSLLVARAAWGQVSEKERIEKEVGISPGDTWEKVIVCVLLWLEKKLDAKRETEAKCKGCGEPSALICAHCGDPEC